MDQTNGIVQALSTAQPIKGRALLDPSVCTRGGGATVKMIVKIVQMKRTAIILVS